jgi:hypothetical protein
MTPLRDDIAAYDKDRRELEAKHAGQWAVFHAGQFVGVYGDFQEAAGVAVDRFGAGPYLIRQIGVEEVRVSPTLTFRPAHTHGAGRV